MSKSILILPGDGIGPEVTAQAVRAMEMLNEYYKIDLRLKEMPIGGAAIDAKGTSLPGETLAAAHCADALFMGAVGGEKWNDLPLEQRPEGALLKLRSTFDFYANLRPVQVYQSLLDASTLRAEVIRGINILIVRELSSGVYFGEPRGITGEGDDRYGYNTYCYSVSEITRIARTGFELARKRRKKLCSIDKANVLEVTGLWREVVTTVGKEYSDVKLSHMYVDNAAMQLVRSPRQFDVILADNMFGDILSDITGVLAGSLGMLPSASLNSSNKGLYEPVHGSAPNIANQDIANPIAAFLSLANMLRYSLDMETIATTLERAVVQVLDTGLRTWDIMPELVNNKLKPVGTMAMGEAIIEALIGLAKDA